MLYVKYRTVENFHESMKYKISWRKLLWIHHTLDIMRNKPKWATHSYFRGENFHEWPLIREFRESFLPRKFPASSTSTWLWLSSVIELLRVIIRRSVHVIHGAIDIIPPSNLLGNHKNELLPKKC